LASIASTNYVDILYSTVLLRPASAAEASAWGNLLDAGTLTTQAVTAYIETSAEAVNFVDPVARLYQGFFNRAPDGPGLQGWVNALRAGTLNLTQIADGFVGSVEFQGIFGANPDPTAFVTALYQNILGRGPDTPGLTGWLNALTSGQLSFAQVALGFTESPEFIADSAAAINNWLTLANTQAQTGATPVYLAGVLPGAVPGPHSFSLTLGAESTTGSGLGGDTVYAPILDFTLGTTVGQSATLPNASISLSGSNNTLTATLLGTATSISPTVRGIQTWNLTNADPARSTATINGTNISGLVTLNDNNSTGPIVLGTPSAPLQSALTNVTITNPGAAGESLTLTIAAAALSGNNDTLNINLMAPASGSSNGGEAIGVGPDSGGNGYETFAITTTGTNVLTLSPDPSGVSGSTAYSANTIAIGGTGRLVLLGSSNSSLFNWSHLKIIDASANSGGVIVVGPSTSVINGLPVGSVTADAQLTTIKGGAGNDTFDISNLSALQVNAITTLDGGAGTNGIYLSSGVVEGSTALTTISHFQKIVDVNPGSGGGVINWSNMGASATTLVYFGNAQSAPITINNAPAGFTLDEEANGSSQSITVNGPNGIADTLNVILGSTTAANASGGFTLNGFETIAITAQGGIDSVASNPSSNIALLATATGGGPETLVLSGTQELDFNGAVNLFGTSTTVTITDMAAVHFNWSVRAATINAASSGGLQMAAYDTFTSGNTGDTITGSLTAHNQILGSNGNDVITGGSAGDVIYTAGGADAITLGAPGNHDEINFGAYSAPANGLNDAGAVVSTTDQANPGYWGLGANQSSSSPAGGLAANTGTSATQSIVANFQAGSATTADSIVFRPAQWAAGAMELGLVHGDLHTPVAAGTSMVAADLHVGDVVPTSADVLILTDATFSGANAVAAALHSGAYAITFAAPLANAQEFAHMILAYNDSQGNAHIADLDVTGATVANSTGLTIRVSDMFELVGVSAQSLQPNNILFH